MDGFPIQPYDILMVVVLVTAAIFGAWKGMAWQLASLGSVVLSCMVAVGQNVNTLSSVRSTRVGTSPPPPVQLNAVVMGSYRIGSEKWTMTGWKRKI